MTDEVLADQVEYYRRRAGEYDATAYGDVAAARARIARLVADLQPSGSVLEIACGTGLWTEALAARADTVTAIDTAAEAVDIARRRVASANVTFHVADVFSWTTQARFDVIFFSAWLSHVPESRFEQFWGLLRKLLAPDGRVLFIDEHVDERAKEAYVAGRDQIVERRLRDGRAFHIRQELHRSRTARAAAARTRLGACDSPGRQRLGPWRGAPGRARLVSGQRGDLGAGKSGQPAFGRAR